MGTGLSAIDGDMPCPLGAACARQVAAAPSVVVRAEQGGRGLEATGELDIDAMLQQATPSSGGRTFHPYRPLAGRRFYFLDHADHDGGGGG
jgi:hypothetical protein